MDGEFKDRLYLVNNLLVSPPKGSRVVWNNPSGGALEWCFYPQNAIIDATGAVRWYMNVDSIYDMENVYHGGVMMGFQQVPTAHSHGATGSVMSSTTLWDARFSIAACLQVTPILTFV